MDFQVKIVVKLPDMQRVDGPYMWPCDGLTDWVPVCRYLGLGYNSSCDL